MRIPILLAAAGWLLPSVGAAAAAPASLSQLEREVLEEINYVRMHPREYAEELRRYRSAYRGALVYDDDSPDGVRSNEGVAAVDEAIAFMDRQRPLPPLAFGSILGQAARDHAGEQGPRGAIGHASANGLGPGDRVKRRGGEPFVAETISYGKVTPEGVVRQFIIDDGVKRRGHRALVFNAFYRFAGVGCGDHRVYGTMCVIDYGGTADGGPVLPGSIATARGR